MGNVDTESVKVSGKGLQAGSLGLVAIVTLGISCVAPAYALTATIGPTIGIVGTQLPAIFIVGFLPMLLVALGYRELNSAAPDSGTSFTWATKAFGPYVGWLGGWGLITATVIVLSNLAGIAVEFFYLLLAEVFHQPALRALDQNLWVNVLTCLVFMSAAVWICYRGATTTKAVQYALVGFQIAVLVTYSVVAFARVAGEPAAAFDWSWLNPLAIPSFSAFAGGLSLSLFIYWGWDVCLTVNEEAKNGDSTPGWAATLTVVIILALYLLTSIATMMFAGLGTTGIGLGNPDLRGNVFAAMAGPVLGPFAMLLGLAVFASSIASLQSTFVSPARTLLAMGHYRAIYEQFARVHPRFKSPAFATIVAGIAAGSYYAIMHIVSEHVLADTILTLGMMICFYYGLTAFSCVIYFRRTLVKSLRNFILRGLCPFLGGCILFAVFLQTTLDSMNPDYGSGSAIFGVGLVFVLGVGLIALGIVLMLIVSRQKPEFFRGETLHRDTPVFGS